MGAYENYQLVKEQIEARRQRAIAEADMRNLEVRKKSEIIRAIDEELEGTGLKIFSAACKGEDITPLKERNTELMSERRKALSVLGYPEDYTEVKYSCKRCSDTGFVGGMYMCSCFREALATENIRSSGMGNLIEKQSFDNFNLEWYRDDEKVFERMKSNLAAAKEFAADFSKTGENLLLIGNTGTGKTHISTAIAREALVRGYDVIYDSSQNIISDFEEDRFKSGYGPHEPKAKKYLECDLLIIDDLGTEFVNQFTVSCLYNLLNTRQNRGLSTVISTNLSADELAGKYEDRIYSRIVGRGCKILVFGGKDHRIFG